MEQLNLEQEAKRIAKAQLAGEPIGDRPLFIPPDTPGYIPSYSGFDAVDCNLVLEGGSLRVQFTAGVLDCFMDRGFFAKEVIGVSSGALSGFNYIMGACGRTSILDIAFCEDKHYLSLWSWLHTGNAFGAKMSFEDIPLKLIPYQNFEFPGSPSHLTAVVANLETGEPEYISIEDPFEGLMYLRASAAMPFVSQTVEIDGKKFLDGGVFDSIPLDYSISTGAKKHIVVLTQDSQFKMRFRIGNSLSQGIYRNYPDFADAVTFRYKLVNAQRERAVKAHYDKEAFVIMPKERLKVGVLEHDPRVLYEAWEEGYKQAELQWDDMMAYLES